ncbi:MAG: TIGR02679 domain-containing protein [Blautia sp.]|uniref:TIGR02679 domain-containing protein n=1 Tax=Blautia sp. TaxID=1955243 RepID=UPI002A75F113|nr:TIGR02679 domain-containing protein [Blautia sp.]MDY3017521.1 TIGR02679 domain-containing protein [Blautia sp.]
MKDIQEKKRLDECLEYFRQRPVYRKIFLKWKEKYASLGRLGGKVVLSGLSKEEKAQLSGFFQKDYTENKTVTISAALFEKCLQDSRFAGITGEELLREYFGQELEVKKEEKQKQLEKRCAFFEGIIETWKGNPGALWIEQVMEKHLAGYELLIQQYGEDSEGLCSILDSFLAAVRRLDENHMEGAENRELLSVFAAKVTGNPHYFDTGTTAEKILTAFLTWHFPENHEGKISGAEDKNRLFYNVGIRKDDLSNDVLVYGIRAWKKDGSLHQGIEGFWKEYEPLRLTLNTLGNIQRVKARQKDIYVVENPAVFSLLIDQIPECTAVCVNGQPRLAALTLLDKLKDSYRLFYAGDYDPEGLLIAQKLKERYGDSFCFWKYEKKWYLQFLSEVELSSQRLKKLDQLYRKELTEIREAMKQEKKAAYQEAMLEIYFE